MWGMACCLWKLTSRMQNRADLYGIGKHAIDNNIIGMHHQFARTRRSPWAVEIGVVGKRTCRVDEPLQQSLGGLDIVLAYIVRDLDQTVASPRRPHDRQAH